MSKTYSTTIEITEEKEYSVTINTGLNLSAWITAGSVTGHTLNPSSYANFAALEADEKAIRQLMLVHNAVDYLATAKAGDSLMQSVINSNVCAKWINISDYAYNKLSANANIKSVMDTADKYGYGEWGKINSTTWGALGNVPIMTANNAPYGTASGWDDETGKEAYKAFDGDPSTYKYHKSAPISGTLTNFIVYKFVNPICIKSVKLLGYTMAGSTYQASTYKAKIKISNDGTNWTNIYEDKSANNPTTERILKCSDNSDYALYVALDVALTNTTWGMTVYTLQFYGRELKPLVPTMTSNTTPNGEAISSSSSSGHDAFKAFDDDLSTYWHTSSGISLPYPLIYDFKSGTRVMMSRLNPLYYKNKCYSKTYKIQGSDTGASDSWIDLTETITYSGSPASTSGGVTYGKPQYSAFTKNVGTYRYYRILIISSVYSSTQTGVSELQFYGLDYSEKEFAPGSTRKTIYDHGVELVSIARSGHNSSYSNYATQYPVFHNGYAEIGKGTPDKCFHLFKTDETIDTTDFTSLHYHGEPYNSFKASSSYPLSKQTDNIYMGYTTSKNPSSTNYFNVYNTIPYNIKDGEYDITNVNGNNYLGLQCSNQTRFATVEEFWLE